MIDVNSQQQFEDHIKNSINVICSSDKGIMSLMKPEFVSASAKDRTFTLKYTVKEWELNPQGVMHGGMITTALDNAFGVLTHCYSDDKFVTTIEMSQHFLKPIFKDDIIYVTVRAVNVGKTIVTLDGECIIKNRDDVIAVTSSSTYMIIKKISSKIEKEN